MASFSVKMPTDYISKIRQLTSQTVPICEKAVKAGAAPVADRIRANAERIISSEATGDMMDSFGIAPVSKDSNGVINVKIGFDGYDRKGVANALKANVLESGRVIPQEGEKRSHKKRTAAEWARAMESGTSGQQKRPFIRPAVKATKKASLEAIEKTVDDEIAKIMK